MGVISNNITSDNSDKSFLCRSRSSVMPSVSRCSISPSGQFTIGNLNPDAPSLRPSHAEEKSVVPSSKPAAPSSKSSESNSAPSEPNSAPSNAAHPSAEKAASEESTVVEEKESVVLSDDGGDMGFDDGYEPAPVEEEEEVKENDPWHLEDVYDGSQNRVAPYARGSVLMDKKKVAKQNELAKKSGRLRQATAVEEERSLFFRVGAAEFDVFSSGRRWAVIVGAWPPA